MKLLDSNRSPLGILTKNILWIVIALSIIATVYFLTLPVNHSEAEDSLGYLMLISHGSFSEQFHPNHLLYNFINYQFFSIWQLFGYENNAELPVKVINIIAGLSALLVLYILATHLNFPFPLRCFCVIGVAFSYGFWWYSVECETYILPIVFVLLCFHRFVLIQKDFFGLVNHLLLGVFNAIAILLHQQHILLCIVILFSYILIFYANRWKITWKKFLGRISLYGAVCSFIVLFSYLPVAVFVKGLSNYHQIVNWSLGYATSGAWGYWEFLGPFKAVIGFSRAFIGGHYIFFFSAISDLLQKIMPNYILREEIFLVKDFSILKSVFLSVLSLAVLLTVVFIIFRTVKHGVLGLIWSYGIGSLRLHFFIISIFYFVVYSLFNIWWEPQNIEFWISLVPFVFLTFGLLMSPLIHKAGIRISMGIILICLFLVNLFGSVLPQTNHNHDYWYVFNSWLIGNCKPDDLVVSGSGSLSDSYVRFYSGAKVLSTLGSGEDLEQKLKEVIVHHKPVRIFFSSTVYSPSRELVNRFHLDTSASKAFFVKLSGHLTLIHSDSYQKVFYVVADLSNISG